MPYIGLLLWFLFLGICVFGYSWLLYIVLAPIGAGLFYLATQVIKWAIFHSYWQHVKKKDPQRYYEKQISVPHCYCCLKKAERAKTEEERKKWLDRAEL